mgnify:CR=1 FL=1
MLIHVSRYGVCHQCVGGTIEVDIEPDDCTTWPPAEDDPALNKMAEEIIWNEVVNYGIEIVGGP